MAPPRIEPVIKIHKTESIEEAMPQATHIIQEIAMARDLVPGPSLCIDAGPSVSLSASCRNFGESEGNFLSYI